MSLETCQNCNTPHEAGQMSHVEGAEGTVPGQLVKVCPNCVEGQSHTGKVVEAPGTPPAVAPKTKGKVKAESAPTPENTTPEPIAPVVKPKKTPKAKTGLFGKKIKAPKKAGKPRKPKAAPAAPAQPAQPAAQV